MGREALLAIGCIQAQRCHTNHCPTGITTQHPWLIRGLDATLKASRLANYVVALRKDVLSLSHACGVPHPALVTADHLELVDNRFGSKTVAKLFGYGRGFGLPSDVDAEEVRRLMSDRPDRPRDQARERLPAVGKRATRAPGRFRRNRTTARGVRPGRARRARRRDPS